MIRYTYALPGNPGFNRRGSDATVFALFHLLVDVRVIAGYSTGEVDFGSTTIRRLFFFLGTITILRELILSVDLWRLSPYGILLRTILDEGYVITFIHFSFLVLIATFWVVRYPFLSSMLKKRLTLHIHSYPHNSSSTRFLIAALQ